MKHTLIHASTGYSKISAPYDVTDRNVKSNLSRECVKVEKVRVRRWPRCAWLWSNVGERYPLRLGCCISNPDFDSDDPGKIAEGLQITIVWDCIMFALIGTSRRIT